LIIYPNGKIQDTWWRKRSHILSKDDIELLIDKDPEVIVVGAGTNGLMKPEKGLADYLISKGIEFICAPNEEAIKIFNRMYKFKKKVGACFHLTC